MTTVKEASLAAIVAALIGLGCRDDTPVEPSAARPADPISDPSYYEADVHIRISGGLRANMVQERTYHVVRTYRDGSWSLEVTNPLDDRKIAGSNRAPGTLVRSNLTRDPLAGDVLGSAGQARFLARFAAAEYTERPVAAGTRRFERSQANRKLIVDLDAANLPIRTTTYLDDRPELVTTREYRQTGLVALLEHEITTQLDQSGAARWRIERRITNIQLERSR